MQINHQMQRDGLSRTKTELSTNLQLFAARSLLPNFSLAAQTGVFRKLIQKRERPFLDLAEEDHISQQASQ